jgi:hypothetical protein
LIVALLALALASPAPLEVFHRESGPINVAHRVTADVSSCRRGVVRWQVPGAVVRPVVRIGLVPRAVAVDLTWKAVPARNVTPIRARVQGGTCDGLEIRSSFIVTPPLPKAGKPYRWWRAKRRENPPWRRQ